MSVIVDELLPPNYVMPSTTVICVSSDSDERRASLESGSEKAATTRSFCDESGQAKRHGSVFKRWRISSKCSGTTEIVALDEDTDDQNALAPPIGSTATTAVSVHQIDSFRRIGAGIWNSLIRNRKPETNSGRIRNNSFINSNNVSIVEISKSEFDPNSTSSSLVVQVGAPADSCQTGFNKIQTRTVSECYTPEGASQVRAFPGPTVIEIQHPAPPTQNPSDEIQRSQQLQTVVEQGPSANNGNRETSSTSLPIIPSYDTVLRNNAQSFLLHPPPLMFPPLPELLPPFGASVPCSFDHRGPGVPLNLRGARRSHFDPAHPSLVTGLPPSAPDLVEFSSPNVQLTRWRRFRSEFDAPPPETSTLSENFQTNCTDPDERGIPFSAGQRLCAEELPQLFPGWSIPRPVLVQDAEAEDEQPKGCCDRGASQLSLIRWFVAAISFVGLSFIIVGIVLGVITASGSMRLTLCLLMIGVGLVLVTVSFIAWRLTSVDRSITPTCCSLFGCRRRRSESVFPSDRQFLEPPYFRISGRLCDSHFTAPPNSFGGIPWRPPPPSYQATVTHDVVNRDQWPTEITNPRSPPPTYRSTSQLHPRQIVIGDNDEVVSAPPSYRSSSTRDVPQRHFVDDEVQNIDVLSLQNAETVPTAIVVTETVQHDDLTELLPTVSNCNGLLPEDATSSPPEPIRYQIDDSAGSKKTPGRGSKITVIDCSRVVPVGFEILQPETSSNQFRRPSSVVQIPVVDSASSPISIGRAQTKQPIICSRARSRRINQRAAIQSADQSAVTMEPCPADPGSGPHSPRPRLQNHVVSLVETNAHH